MLLLMKAPRRSDYDRVVNGIGDDSHIAYSLIIKQIYFFYLINERMKRLNSSIIRNQAYQAK